MPGVHDFLTKLDDLVDTARRNNSLVISRTTHPEIFLEKSVLKICSKFTGEHPCQSATSPFCCLFCQFVRFREERKGHNNNYISLLNILFEVFYYLMFPIVLGRYEFDIVSYANYSTPFTYKTDLNIVIKKLEVNSTFRLFKWFKQN